MDVVVEVGVGVSDGDVAEGERGRGCSGGGEIGDVGEGGGPGVVVVFGGGDGKDFEAEDLGVREGGAVAWVVLRMDGPGEEGGSGCKDDEEVGIHGGGD